MPLIKSSSPEAFKSNLKAEMAAGKGQKQALAIAYSVKRKGRADGGIAPTYDSPLSGNEESAFQQWKSVNAPQDSGADYDLRGAFKEGLSPAANGHWPDTYKKPNHETFSNESIYAAQQPQLAGRWNGEQYVPANVVQAEKMGMKRGGALDVAYQIKREGRAMGGPPPASWQVRSEARGMTHSGPIMSAVAGRTDHLPMSVSPGSYVVNADTVSHIGQNNTAAGHAILSHMFGKTGPYGSGPTMGIKAGRGAPPPPKAPKLAKGGASQGDGSPVEINAAGGEFVIPVETVKIIGSGDVERGHKILDRWMENQRKDHIRTLRRLPGPAKS